MGSARPLHIQGTLTPREGGLTMVAWTTQHQTTSSRPSRHKDSVGCASTSYQGAFTLSGALPATPEALDALREAWQMRSDERNAES